MFLVQEERGDDEQAEAAEAEDATLGSGPASAALGDEARGLQVPRRGHVSERSERVRGHELRRRHRLRPRVHTCPRTRRPSGSPRRGGPGPARPRDVSSCNRVEGRALPATRSHTYTHALFKGSPRRCTNGTLT
jgi:hypothetical protein